jgi:hypothetical protein
MAIQGHLGRAGLGSNSLDPDGAYALAVKQFPGCREDTLPGAFDGAVIGPKYVEIRIHRFDPLTRE